MQNPIIGLTLATAIPLQAFRNRLPRSLPLKIRAVQEPEILGTGRLARKPQAPDVGAQVLVHFQRRARRPVGVAAVGPGHAAPAGIHKGCGLGDVCFAEHVSKHGEDLGLGGGVVLGFDAVALLGDDGDEEDGGAGEEAGGIE